MKTFRTLFLLGFSLTLLLMAGCAKDNDNNSETSKGLIQIIDPEYTNGILSFKLSMQYSSPGEATDLEYVLYEGSNLIKKATASTIASDGGLNVFFETELLEFSFPQSTYSGKTILIWADPDNKKTLSIYTTQQYVDAYKKVEIKIP